MIGSGLAGGPNLANVDRFGFSLANFGKLRSEDTSYQTALAIGAVGDDTGGNRRGAVHMVFVKSDGTLLTDGGLGNSPNRKIAHQLSGGPTLADVAQFGQSLASIGDVNGDGTPDLAVAADGDSIQGIYRGAAYVLLLTPNGTVRTTNGITRIASGVGGGPTLANRDYFGAAIANLGDIDGDGTTDIAIGATNDDIGGTDRGAVHVLRLNPVPNVTNASPPSVKPNGATRIASGFNVDNSSIFGVATVNIGDLDGDGVDDLAVGLYDATISGAAVRTGAVRILFMARDGAVKSTTEIGGSLGLSGYDRFGTSIANIGDQDGDGVVDLAVGAQGDNTGGADRGAVYLLRLNSNGTLKGFDKLANGVTGMPTLTNGGYFGRSVASLGDIDGDGRTELAIGAMSDSGNGTQRGAVYVLDFSPLGSGVGLSVSGVTRIASGLNGGPVLPDSARLGSSLANIGDIDGDGITDMAVGAIGENGSAGALYILFMNRNQIVRESARIADLTSGGPDLVAQDSFGISVATLGDIDGDGRRDVAVGALFDSTNGPNRGAVYILALATNGTAKSSLKLASGTGGLGSLPDVGLFGTSIALFGDQNRDGVRDLVVGAALDSTFGTTRGTAYILRMNAAPNLAPILINGGPPEISENSPVGTDIVSFSTFDPNPGDTFTYTLVPGSGSADNALFTLSGSTLRSNAVFDFEAKSSYTFRVRTTDQGGLFVEQSGTIAVNNVNETPTALNLSANTIAENSVTGTSIGTFSTTDPDASNTFIYSLVAGTGSTDNASFAIVGNTLQSNAVFNFESRSSYSIRVRTADQGGLAFEQTFNVTVTNQNETPTALALTGNTIAENSASGTAIGTFTTTDPDASNTFTYTLLNPGVNVDNQAFSIVGSQLRSFAVFDFEAKASYSVVVRTTDQGGLFFDRTFTVNVTNVNETPTALNLSANTIAENSASGTVIGTFATTDPDANSTFSYSLLNPGVNVDNQGFSIVGNQLRSFAVFDFEAKSSYSVVVRTTDQGNLSFDRTFTVNITDVNEVIPNTAPSLDASGNPFAILGAGSRQSTEMRQGVLVSDILARGAGGNPISDPDAGALRGIALTAVDQTLGNFQYTLVTTNPQESDWVNVDAAGALSDTSALLLPTTARLRFTTGRIPHHASAPFFLSVESKLDAGLTFRAWDQTSGAAGGRANTSTNGGTSAFSAATETSKVYFEVRLFRSFNPNASLNVYTLEAEFNALTGGAFQDRSTNAFTGFTVLLSPVPELGTSALFRLYFGIQFNDDGTETDMGYRYLTSNAAEATFLEGIGPAAKRPQREGTYFRELGVSNGTATIGYVFDTQQPGTSQLTQIYRTDVVNKPTRPPGTSEGGAPTSFKPQENGDHVYTTNTAFEMSKLGTWRIESTRGFVRELNPNPVSGAATAAAVAAVTGAESIESAPSVGSQTTPAPARVRSAIPEAAESSVATSSFLLSATGVTEHVARLVAIPSQPAVPVSPTPTAETMQAVSTITPPRPAASTSASVASTTPGHLNSPDSVWPDAVFADLAFVTGVLTAV